MGVTCCDSAVACSLSVEIAWKSQANAGATSAAANPQPNTTFKSLERISSSIFARQIIGSVAPPRTGARWEQTPRLLLQAMSALRRAQRNKGTMTRDGKGLRAAINAKA